MVWGQSPLLRLGPVGPGLVPGAEDQMPPTWGVRPLIPGNIDLHRRPIVRNPDGTISTVRSMSFGTPDGEVLVPTVSEDGRIMTDDEAMGQFRQTGRHLGIFSAPEAATAYAQQLHSDQAREYGPLAAASAPAAPPMAAAVQATSRHRFGTRNIVGILADAVLAGTGRPAVYGPAMERRSLLREQQENEDREYSRRRTDTNADWLAHQEWERAHPAPAQPTSLQRDAEYYRSIGRPELAERLLVNRASPLVAVDRVDEEGNTVREYVRPSATTPAPNAPPPPAVGTVRGGYRFNGGNPADPSAWAPVDGGPTRTGSGTFR